VTANNRRRGVWLRVMGSAAGDGVRGRGNGNGD
jgi:hypothetical protein